MGRLKKLAGETLVYGLSSIIGRFLNYLLVPLHTEYFTKDQYGISGEMYAYVSFLVILLTYGMETAFFRYFNKWPEKREKIYSTALFSLITTSAIFIVLCAINAQSIANTIGYPDHSEYVTWFAIIVGFDAISSIPLARLRAENKAMRFATVNLLSVGINILLNVILIVFVMDNSSSGIGIGYVFIANLVASIFKLAMLTPDIFKKRPQFDFTVWKEMFRYGWPILFFGLAGIINETLDRILIPDILYDVYLDDGYSSEDAMIKAQSENGVYNAVYKISMLITLFVQAFRYAAEPFFFGEAEKKDAKKTYSMVMTYFVIIVATIFLGVNLYLDIFKYVVPNESYWEGLKVVPILLMANIFVGIYFNQSVWYKLTEKTIWGFYLAVIGAVITITMNFILIPEYSYVGAAWTTFTAYGVMMLASYYFGQKHYPIKYNLKKILFYLGLSVGLYFLSELIDTDQVFVDYLLKTLIFAFYLFIIWGLEQPYKLFKR